MKAKKWRLLSLTLAAALAVSTVTGDISVVAASGSATEEASGTQITDEEMDDLLEESTGSATTRTRNSVHDPSIVDAGNGTYYAFGSHMAVSKTTDLENWTTVTSETTDSTLFANSAGQQVSYEDAFKTNATTEFTITTEGGEKKTIDFGTYNISAWISDNTVQGNMWAPDVIYNTTMNKWCMYLSLNGADWNSAIILLTSDTVDGKYVYQGPIVFTGFTTTDGTKSFKDTDLELVIGEQTELPEKYQKRTKKTATADTEWGSWWPHAIDPNVFYDDAGNLWLTYGSWSGGICMLELDENTGLRDYTVTYESDVDTKKQSWTSDEYFGKRIAGGYYVSGEGPYIQKIGSYYYLFISYGFYSPEGGYNMRIFRSKTPDGPYVDSEGNNALYTEWVQNYNGSDNRGERLMAAYKWDTMDVAETAQGHNSAFVDKDGKAYVVYHTKFADGTASHELRVHQLFVNEDGWLVAAPYEYDGETLSTTAYQTADIAGSYDTILHEYVQDYANLAYATPKSVSLNSDNTVSGTYTGTWSVDDKNNITLNITGNNAGTYKGVLVEQKIDNTGYSTLCFTAVNEKGLCIWGSRQLGDKIIIAQNVANFDFGVPEATYTDFTLPTEGSSDATITWTSSDPTVLSADGRIASERTEDKTVTLTARISYGDYYYDKTFKVIVRAGDGTFSEKTLIASYFENAPQDLSDKMDGSLSVANPYNSGTTAGIDISGGVTIEFDVTRTGDLHKLGTILGFMGGGRLYFTPVAYLGYNATGGYYDANNITLTDYIGDGAHVTLKLTPNGFEVYVGDELVYDQSIISTDNGGGTLTDYNNVLTWLNQSAETLYFGYGSWWAAAGYDEANCKISNVKCYVEATPTAEDEAAKKAPNTAIWYEKDSLTLESTDAITYDKNPFYGVDTNCIYLAYTINFASDAAKNGWDGIFSFYNSETGGRISVQTAPYICYNEGLATNNVWIDLNNPNNTASGGVDWAADKAIVPGTDYRVEILITKDGITMKVDDETIACSYAASGSSASYESLLAYISTCDKLTWGVGMKTTSYWGTEKCTLKNIVIASSPDLKKTSVDEVKLTSASDFKVQDNPFYGEELLELDIDYTLTFAENAAKNGYDGIFSFYNSSNTGRVAMLTNPYILYNDMAGTWQDLNKPANSANGGTNWADSAEYGTDYKVSVKITQDEVSVTIDDVPISLSTSSSSDTLTGADILDYISKCDKFTFGVGLAQASFWNTELCTIKNFSAKAIGKDTQSFIGEVEEVEKITAINDNSWKINTNDAILYLDNPVKGVELEKLKISYDVTFADNAAKNGWDGLFSFYDPGTNGRVSIQSAPFLCFNDWAGVWANINKPGLDGSTDWAASAVAGTKHHVDITVTADEIVMSVDDTPIDFAEEASDAYTGYQNILDLISKCENLTIGVGLATSSSWNTEICTLENLTIVANDGEDEDEDSDGRENPDSGSKPGNNGSQPNNGSKPGTGSTDKGDTDNDTTDTPAAGTATGKTHIEERESDGKQIIVDKNGEVIVNKLVTIDSKTYITNAQGEIIKNRFATTAKGNTVYATKTGAIKKSITFTVNGKRYYAKPSGAIAKSGFIKTALGNTVYATKSGVLKSGKVFTVDGKKYYAKASGAIAKNRWVTVGNKKYYCNKKGVITKTKTVS